MTILTRPSRTQRLLWLAVAALLGMAAPAHAQIDSSGNDFIVGFLNNSAGGPPSIELHLTSSVNMQVQVEYPVGTIFWAAVTLTAGSVSIVPLPSLTSTGWPTGTSAANAVRVASVNPSQQFTVYMINRAPFTSDAGLALPVDSLANLYRIIAAPPTIAGGTVFGSQFVVVATQDGTTVTITPSQSLASGQPATIPFAVALNRGQGWFAVGAANGAAGDLSGTLVQSTFPVSVTNGVGCVNIDVGACDHVFEVAQPVQTWGTGIPVANLPGFASNGVRYKIMAAENNTTILQDGVLIGLLNEGQFITTPRLTGGHIFDGVEAGDPKPIFVMQLMPGGASGICAIGDPSIGNIIPAAQYLSGYTFSTVGGGQFACNFVTIIAPNAAVGTLTLDGVAVPAGSFTPIGGSGFSSAIVPVSSGVHKTASASPHGITVEGYNNSDSYLYPGGAALDPINVDLKLTKKAQVDECAAVGAQVTYQVCYQNTGDDPANNVVIKDALPAELDFVSASGGGTFSAGTVTWTVASAPANMPDPMCFDLTVSVNGSATPGGEIVNAASIDSDDTDPITIQERTPVCTNQPPDAVCQDVTISTDPGICTAASASVNNGSSDPDPDDSITLDQTPAGPYGLGPTPVTLTVTDTQGATDSCEAVVLVVDTELPAISCPAPQTAECTGASSANVAVGPPVAADNCSVASASCTPSSGSFPLGPTLFSCTATDGSSNESSCNSSVTVVDTTQPSISCPAPIVAECAGSGSATVTPGTATASDICAGVAVSGPGTGSYPLGTTTVTYSAVDAVGLANSCAATIQVVDTTKPTVSCVESYNPSTKNVPNASNVNEDGFYRIGGGDSCTAPTIKLGSYTLTAGETIKVTQARGKSGVTLVNTMGPGNVRHFQVGPGDAVITATDGSGNSSKAICLVPPPPK